MYAKLNASFFNPFFPSFRLSYINSISGSNEFVRIGSLVKKLDSNFARAELFPAFNNGRNINAAAEREDNMVFINLGTDTDSDF